MKIRKLYALTSSSKSLPQAYACGFNQTRWDVMTEFSPPSSPLPPPPLKVNGDVLSTMTERSDDCSLMERDEDINDVTGQDFECTDGDDGRCADEENNNDREVVVLCSAVDEKNGQCMRDTLCEHHLAIASKHLSKGSRDKETNKSPRVVEIKGGKRKARDEVVLCSKMDGKSWQCKREAMYGKTLCEHHLGLRNNHIRQGSSDEKKKKSAEMLENKGGKRNVRTKKPSLVAAASSEIYYRSSFGPSRSKNRGNDREKNVRDNNLLTHLELDRVSGPSNGIVYINLDDDDDVEGGFD